MFTTIDLIALDGRVIATAGFERPLKSLSDPWVWARRVIARRYECDETEVETVEPDEDDRFGDDYVSVNGVKVARYCQRFPTMAEIIEHEFPAAAE